jgi:hypothetical protein
MLAFVHQVRTPKLEYLGPGRGGKVGLLEAVVGKVTVTPLQSYISSYFLE